MIVSKIDPLKAVLCPENTTISRIILFCSGKQTLFTKQNNSTIANYIKEGKKLDRKWVNNWAVT